MMEDIEVSNKRDDRYRQIVDEASFLLGRLDGLSLDDDTDDLIRDWNGHVAPSIARLQALLWGKA